VRERSQLRAPCGRDARSRGELEPERSSSPRSPPNRKLSEIQIQVDNEHHTEDLLDFLRKNGCIALRAGERALSVQAPECRTDRAERRKLRAYLNTWQATHSGTDATLAD
jgi:hypothetical protein